MLLIYFFVVSFLSSSYLFFFFFFFFFFLFFFFFFLYTNLETKRMCHSSTYDTSEVSTKDRSEFRVCKAIVLH
jgi:hypothetical protein